MPGEARRSQVPWSYRWLWADMCVPLEEQPVLSVLDTNFVYRCVCSHSLWAHALLIHSFKRGFHRTTKKIILTKFNLSVLFSFMDHTFGIISKYSLLTPALPIFPYTLFSRVLLLNCIFRSLTDFINFCSANFYFITDLHMCISWCVYVHMQWVFL